MFMFVLLMVEESRGTNSFGCWFLNHSSNLAKGKFNIFSRQNSIADITSGDKSSQILFKKN